MRSEGRRTVAQAIQHPGSWSGSVSVASKRSVHEDILEPRGFSGLAPGPLMLKISQNRSNIFQYSIHAMVKTTGMFFFFRSMTCHDGNPYHGNHDMLMTISQGRTG